MSYADYPQILQNIEHFGGKTNIVEHNTNEEELKKQAEKIEDDKLLILEGRGYADKDDSYVSEETTDKFNFLIDTEMSEEEFKEKLESKLVISTENKYVLKMDDYPAYDFHIIAIKHNVTNLKHTYLTISLTPKSIKDGYKAANNGKTKTTSDLNGNHIHIYPSGVNKSALDHIRVSPNKWIILYIFLGIIGIPILILIVYTISEFMSKNKPQRFAPQRFATQTPATQTPATQTPATQTFATQRFAP